MTRVESTRHTALNLSFAPASAEISELVSADDVRLRPCFSLEQLDETDTEAATGRTTTSIRTEELQRRVR